MRERGCRDGRLWENGQELAGQHRGRGGRTVLLLLYRCCESCNAVMDQIREATQALGGQRSIHPAAFSHRQHTEPTGFAVVADAVAAAASPAHLPAAVASAVAALEALLPPLLLNDCDYEVPHRIAAGTGAGWRRRQCRCVWGAEVSCRRVARDQRMASSWLVLHIDVVGQGKVHQIREGRRQPIAQLHVHLAVHPLGICLLLAVLRLLLLVPAPGGNPRETVRDDRVAVRDNGVSQQPLVALHRRAGSRRQRIEHGGRQRARVLGNQSNRDKLLGLFRRQRWPLMVLLLGRRRGRGKRG